MNNSIGPNAMVNLSINGKEVTAVIDTAAQVTVMNDEFARKLQDPLKITEYVELKGAGKDNTIKAGFARKVKIKLADKGYAWDVYVAPIMDTFY